MPKTAKPFVRKSIYIKAIAISKADLEYIRNVKYKKSAAGKLSEIIQFYKSNYLKLSR